MKFFLGPIFFLAFAHVALSTPIVSRASEAADWSYLGRNGPRFWARVNPQMYSLCGATTTFQSPVNIKERKAVRAGSANMGSILRISEAEYRPLSEPNNYVFECENEGSCGTLTLGSKTFILRQFHFHASSEHKMNGRRKDFEIHLVHSDEAGNRAVVGVLLDAKNGRGLVDLWRPINSIKDKKPFTFDLNRVIDARSGFYSFSGSLTTPPCSIDVQWVIQKTVKRLPKRQMREFMKLVGPVPRGNWRPIQRLNGRRIDLFE